MNLQIQSSQLDRRSNLEERERESVREIAREQGLPSKATYIGILRRFTNAAEQCITA